MREFNVDKIDDLSDVFCAVMGGRPDSIREIEAFMKESPLQQLMFASDVEKVIEYDGYFPEETVNAVYALLPVKIPLNGSKNWIMTPQSFAKLSKAKETLPASRIVNIPFPKAQRIDILHFDDKVQNVIKAITEAKRKQEERARLERERKMQEQKELAEKLRQYEELEQRERERRQKEQILREQKLKEQQERELQEKLEAQRKAEEKELKAAQNREKARLRMQKYRAEHPEKRKSYYKRLETLPEKERKRQRKANNMRNAVYRAKNREQIRAWRNAWREQMKEENPELLKAYDKKHNAVESRKEAGQRYYQKHKEEISQKARQNPMVKVYKQRYKIKKRLVKTGPIISGLLQGLMAAKTKSL